MDKTNSRIAILGTGAWGTALATVLLNAGNSVAMWGIDDQEINDLKSQKNTKFFGDKKFDGKLFLVTKDINQIADFKPQFVIIAVPSVHIENVLYKVVNIIKSKPIYVNVAKGFDPKSLKTWSPTINRIIKNKSKGLVALIGPSFAIEVYDKNRTIVNVVCEKINIAKRVKKIFDTDYFKCVAINDMNGAETISALKNVMAIATGILYSQHTSINTRSAILAQIAKEISYILKIMGGKQETLYQFCGIGDIYLTCTSEKSRNFSLGLAIGRLGSGQIKEMIKTKTVEGYWATKIAYEIIKKYKIHAPIIIHLYKILYKNADSKDFINYIMKAIKE